MMIAYIYMIKIDSFKGGWLCHRTDREHLNGGSIIYSIWFVKNIYFIRFGCNKFFVLFDLVVKICYLFNLFEINCLKT